MSSETENDNQKLRGRGEKSTPRFVAYVITQILSENKLLYAAVWTGLVVFGVIHYTRLNQDCNAILEVWKPLVDILAGLGAFTAPFIFVIIAVFPSFSEKFRQRLERPSRRTGKPLAQSMLDHFVFVLISSLGMMLLGYAAKYLIEVQVLSCDSMTEPRACVLSGLVILILMLLAATVIELLRSVRTMYVMIVADYTKS